MDQENLAKLKKLSFICGYSFCEFTDDYFIDAPGVIEGFDFVKKTFDPEVI